MSHLDVGRKESEPYDLFLFAINAEQTKEKYHDENISIQTPDR
jgi:hypothetical protein